MIEQLPDDATLQRVCSEFMEMPGLRLTSKQAQRLWGLDERVCASILNHLVESHFLSRGPQGTYGRCSEGPVVTPRPAPLKATLRPAARKLPHGV